MEAFEKLEARVARFITAFKTLKAENCELKTQIEHLQNSILSHNKSAAELSQQRELDGMALDDLMKILDDGLAECEK